MATDPLPPDGPSAELPAPLGGSRPQAMQRLQVGVFGLAAMLLLVGLANIILNNARQNQAQTLPPSAPSNAPQANASAVSDPLADAGVVPDMPSAKPTGRAPAAGQAGTR